MRRPALESDRGAARGRGRGQALTEFALLSPAFFLLVFGIIGGALMLNAQATLDNATREAARQVALCGGAMGSWTDGGGTTHSGGPNGSPCVQAGMKALYQNFGILPVTPGTDGSQANPQMVLEAPAASWSADCSGSATPYYGGSGCAVEVRTTYQFSFLINAVLGSGVPSITLTSVARSAGQ